MKITWNTGASYTPEGQVITAQLLPNRWIIFMDHSRGINGSFQLPKFVKITSPHALKLHVMDHYLRNDYNQDRWSESIALQRDAITG